MKEGKDGKDGADGGQEMDSNGKPAKGGGYMMKGGKLVKMEKSSIGETDLEKSLERLADFADEDGPTRKAALLEKAATDELTKAENDELFQILGGDAPAADVEPSVGESVTKSFRESDELNKAIDVSDYLRENHEALEKSLHAIGEEIQKSDNRRHEFAILQAKAVVDIGNLVKSLSEDIALMAGQPSRGPKSRGVQGASRPLEKSMGGEAPAEDQLNKGQVLDALEEMSKSADHIAGEPISLALSKYEGSNMISPTMLGAVKAFRQEQKAAH